MRTLLPALIIVLMAGCTPPAYVQPKPSEPHAILKIRSTIHRKYRGGLGRSITLGEYAIDPRVYGAEQGGDARTVHIRIRPEPNWLTAYADFSYMDSRTVSRMRTVTESTPCGSSPTGTPQTCTHTRTEHRTETEHYTVTTASCQDRTYLKPRAGGVYLVQYDFYADADCRLTCFEQLPRPDGTFQLVACPP